MFHSDEVSVTKVASVTGRLFFRPTDAFFVTLVLYFLVDLCHVSVC